MQNKLLHPNETSYSLGVTATNATVVVKRAGSTITAGTPIYSDDVLTITATADSGYTMSALTVNGDAFQSGKKYTVLGNTTIVATATANEPAPENP